VNRILGFLWNRITRPFLALAYISLYLGYLLNCLIFDFSERLYKFLEEIA